MWKWCCFSFAGKILVELIEMSIEQGDLDDARGHLETIEEEQLLPNTETAFLRMSFCKAIILLVENEWVSRNTIYWAVVHWQFNFRPYFNMEENHSRRLRVSYTCQLYDSVICQNRTFFDLKICHLQIYSKFVVDILYKMIIAPKMPV